MERPKTKHLLRDLGRRVAELRRARSLTQAEMAELIDVTPRYLQAIEAGNENLTVTSLAGLAEALHVSVLELFEPPASRARRRPGRPKNV